MREARGVRWQNWGKNESCRPAVVFYPQTRSDLVRIVQRARTEGRRIRALGAGHSLSALVPTDEFLVDCGGLNQVDLDLSEPDRPHVTMGPGATIAKVNALLERRGFALPSNVVFECAQFGGLVAAGCHGSGRAPTLSEALHEMEVVTGTGDVRTFRAGDDPPEVFDAARIHLGLFGLISSLTLDVVPSFRVTQHQMLMSDAETLERIEALVTQHDTVDLYGYPFTGKVWTRILDRTERPITCAPRKDRLRRAHLEFLSHAGSAAYRVLEWFPEATPEVCRRSLRTLPIDEQVVDIVEATHWRTSIENFRMHIFEVAFPVGAGFANVHKAWKDVYDLIAEFARRGLYPCNVTVNARFTHGSTALLSPARGNELTCYLEILGHQTALAWDEFSGATAEAWLSIPGARPHWAKELRYIPQTEKRVRAAFGEALPRFAEIRASLGVDPEDRFVNAMTRALVLPPKSAESLEKDRLAARAAPAA